MLSTVLAILHNVSKRVPTRSSFAACQALDVLIPLLKAEVIVYAAKSLLILAYLTDEENNHVIMADEGKYTYFANKVGVGRNSKWDHSLRGLRTAPTPSSPVSQHTIITSVVN